MKLELKHLAGYLPYGLKIHLTQFMQENIIVMKGVTVYKDVITVWSEFSGYGDVYKKKLILLPLSDLTKEIEVNGEKFVPISELKLQCSYAISNEIDKFCIYKNYGDMPYWIIQKLLEWHFDIYGLIENNLAIDKNTL